MKSSRIAAILLMVGGGLLVTTPALSEPGLQGDYFDTVDLQTLMTTRVDPTIDFTNWGSSPTGTSVTADSRYSERWTGFVQIPSTGTWTFTTLSNDGVRLWVDGAPLIDNWTSHAATQDTGAADLVAGWYPIRLEHFQQDGAVVIQLSFSGPGQSQIIIPSSHLDTVGTDPTVDAGADQFLILPNDCATFSGSATAPGSSTIAAYAWSQQNGPTTASLSGAATPTLTACNLVEGSYLFRLTATDSEGDTGFDEASVSVVPEGGTAQITGEMRKWHRITVTFDGPATGETASPNPFLDYRLQVTFVAPSGKQHQVPGFYAADGNAAQTGATTGNKWRAHFVPDEEGAWSFLASFETGTDIAISTSSGTAVPPIHGTTGNFTVGPTNKAGVDLRGKGLLRYVGGHHLQFAETGEYFLKGGADSPENFLGYADFDGTFDTGGINAPDTNFLHAYAPHLGDWNAGDPTWKSGKGKGMIGALNYLSGQGMNSVYFLTYNIDGGDGRDVWVWTDPNERFRFDVSKLDQWEIVFSYMDLKGIQLHVITQEIENDHALDGGTLGRARKLYYRELVARFSHHLAVAWNLGEENSNSDSERKSFAQYIRSLDPYDHPITVHTYIQQASTFYNGIVGDPNFEATSIQGDGDRYNEWAIELRNKSSNAGRKWAIYGDEQVPAVDDTLSNLNTLRRDSLWGNLMGGGAGVEWYFGYQANFGDLTSEDWRITEALWEQTRFALEFFQNNLPFESMAADNSLASGTTGELVLAKTGQVYAVYIPNGGNVSLSLPAGSYTVKWYDPRTGGPLTNGITINASGPGSYPLGSPPGSASLDWAILVESTSGEVDTTPPAPVENLRRGDT